MDSSHQINVPLRSGGKKMKKRRDLDALIAHSLTKKGSCRRSNFNSGDKLLSVSTDDPDEYTWPKVSHSNERSRKRKYLFRMCGPIFFLAGVAMMIGFMYWLYFDLRQQIYDYRQKIEEVSATSQNLPDTLQKWHETSTSLLRNQTTLFLKLNDMQHTVELLRINFTEYRTFIEAHQNNVKDEKLVADFGAKIEALASDIESIKDHYDAVVDTQKILQTDLMRLESNFTEIKNVSLAMKVPFNYSTEIEGFKSSLLVDLKILETNLNAINDTLSQKSQMLHDELVVHKTKLDELFDRFENITSHVTSIENSWPKYKQKIIDYEMNSNHMENEISKLKNKSQRADYAIQNMCSTCKSSFAEPMQSYYKRAQISQTTLRPLQLWDTITNKEIDNLKIGGGITPIP